MAISHLLVRYCCLRIRSQPTNVWTRRTFKHRACRSQPASGINLIQRFSTFQPCSNFLDQIYRQQPRFGRRWVGRQEFGAEVIGVPPLERSGEHSREPYDEHQRGRWPASEDLFDHLVNRWTFPTLVARLCTHRSRKENFVILNQATIIDYGENVTILPSVKFVYLYNWRSWYTCNFNCKYKILLFKVIK